MATATKNPPKAKSPPKQKSPKNPPKQKGPGRPKLPLYQRAARGYKTTATGETRNSPFTDPNIVFWLGIILIIFAGWSSGRLKTVFTFAWGNPGANWFTDIKVFGSQFLFLFLMVFTARAFPPLARIYLVMIGGMWILYIMKNPQIVQLLNWTSVGAQNQQQFNQIVTNLQSSFSGGSHLVK